MEIRDTIIAPITAPGKAGVSLLRLSGPAVLELLPRLSPRWRQIATEPRKQIFSSIYAFNLNELEAQPLDSGLICFFESPNSFTGEPVLEVGLHGSPFLVERFLQSAFRAGVRLARPGEFTERAFLEGRIDLTQAEAVADLIASQTELQAKLAREQLSGKLQGVLAKLADPLRALVAEIEAYIDFPEEGIEPLQQAQWLEVLQTAEASMQGYLDSYAYGRICRDGALVVLAGLPNAGKSSLLNVLLGEERAIVTAEAGTTRDTIEESANIAGLSVRFCDTAGLLDQRSSREVGEVEQKGIERSWAKVSAADVVLYLLDASRELAAELAPLPAIQEKLQGKLLLLVNKIDLVSSEEALRLRDVLSRSSFSVLFISAASGLGVGDLREEIKSLLLGDSSVENASWILSNSRHKEALEQAKEAVCRAMETVRQNLPAELSSLEIRNALGALNDIIGVTSNDEILGLVFSKFCIGK